MADEIIYLTNLSDRDIFHRNAPWAFTNVLKVPLELKANLSYEVALRKLILPSERLLAWKNDSSFQLNIYGLSGAHRKELLLEYRPIMGMPPDYDLIIRRINTAVSEELSKTLTENWMSKKIFQYSDVYDRIMYTDVTMEDLGDFGYLGFSVAENLANFLGLKANAEYQLFPGIKLVAAPHKPLLTGGVDLGIVYCDLVEPVRYGNTLTPVLDIFPIDSGNGGMTSGIMHKYLYKRINKRIIDSISIKMTDQMGRLLRFEEGTSVTLVLHIRVKL